jgi:ATP-binding cassette, subfamily B, multidrug efflux pump
MSNTKNNSRPAGGFGGPMGGAGAGEKAKNFKQTMLKLFNYLKPYKISMIIVMIFAILSTIFTIYGPKLLGKATTKLFEGLMGKMHNPLAQIDFGYIGNIIIILLGLYIVSTIFSYIQGFIMTGISQKVTYDFRKEISSKINRMPLAYFDSKTHGEILSRITNDVDTVSTTLSQTLTQLVTSVVTIVGVLIMMLTISPLMTLVALLMLPVTFILIMFIITKSQKYFKGQQVTLGKLNGHVEEIYSGHEVMKAYNGEDKSIKYFKEVNGELYNSAWKSQFLSGLMMPVVNLVSNFGYVAIAVLGGYLAVKKAITVGDIQSFIQYVRQFTQPIMQTANSASALQSTAAAAERVFEFLNETEEVEDVKKPQRIDVLKGKVTFDNILFGYEENKTIIKGFNADIKPGQKVAIVGPTGAGKTTIVNLLMRFYDVNEGSIKIDGIDIRNMLRSDLRKILGMVLQDAWLFNGSIKENIAYGNLMASDEEIEKAALLAHVDHFVHTLPEGYNMVINEEANNISQGQKQLLTIARAILANPAILILDEATSSVDTRTEVLIQKAMENLMKGRTSFIIAHRLSTIRDADLILVMKDGNIVEQGNHQELLNKNGFYSELYNSQFETDIA